MPTNPGGGTGEEEPEGSGRGEPGPSPEADGEPPADPCARARLRQGPLLDNDHWTMVPLDADHDPTTTASSSATWELPEGGRVRWAGPHFSGAGGADAPDARAKGPGMASYRTVTATDTRVTELPGYPAYQAFVEVTDLLRTHGGGQWWVADTPAREGRGLYAGWSLVVVLEDPEAGSYQQVMVLDEARTVFQGGGSGPFAASGLLPAAVPARLDVVAWEGDAGLGGPVTAPTGGRGEADNAFTGSVRGAQGASTRSVLTWSDSTRCSVGKRISESTRNRTP
ncbi:MULTISPECIES: hypothetical protein [unclassified Nocardiopsis]|uniref:hypothetical protein n=1 Tax=unclassified Nocardiopsis TaxID=2649073 RepID=UPI000B156D7F|nr:hypothetical protein [Nocardiopsis sp. TSRI0078]